MISRILSIVFALGYLTIALISGDPEIIFRVAMFLILPLACIWFGDEMGQYTGVAFGRGAITSETSGGFVVFGGWLLLVVPIVIAIISAIRS